MGVSPRSEVNPLPVKGRGHVCEAIITVAAIVVTIITRDQQGVTYGPSLGTEPAEPLLGDAQATVTSTFPRVLREARRGV